jgi:hypothetical protein
VLKGMPQTAQSHRVSMAPQRLTNAAFSGSRGSVLRSALGEQDLGPRKEEILKALKVSDLIKDLDAMGVKHDDCFEKEELVQRLLQAKSARLNGGTQLSMPLITSGIPMIDNPGPAVQYYVLNVSFPNSPHPYDILSMMVDTASPTSIVADDVANRHAANKTGVADPGGNWYQVDFGAMTVSEKDVGFSFQPVVADISVYPGLLGLDFFTRFDVLFDFAAERCVLYPSGVAGSLPLAKGMVKAPVEQLQIGRLATEGYLYLGTTKGTEKVTLVLDSGASQSVMNWKAAESLGLTSESPEVTKKGYMKDAGQQLAEASVSLAIGEESSPSSSNICIANLPGFMQMGLQDTPAMILGADVMKQRGEMLLSAAAAQLWLPRK